MNRSHFIYAHISPSGKVYVGQTVNIKKRWGFNGEHYKTKKKDGSFIQPYFARAIIKYGWDKFEHKVILENVSKSEANYAEKYLIKWYKLHDLSYNCTDGGEGCCGIHRIFSDEEKRKISERVSKNPPMKGKKHTSEAIAKIIAANRNRTYTPEQKAAMIERGKKLGQTPMTEKRRKKYSEYRKAHPETWIGGWNKKEVYQYDLEGNYVTSYPSASEASINLFGGNGNVSKILENINGKVASALGYIWKSEKIDHIDLSRYKIVRTKRGARLIDMSEEGKRKRRDGHGKPVNQYTLDGTYLTTYNSVTDAKETIGYKGGGIAKCCLHRSKYITAGGYRWEYDTGANRTNIKVA